MPTALIIGASRGLGRALAEEHLARGWLVIATVRDPASLADLAARNGETLTVETLDTRDWAGVDALHARLRGRPVDLLLVNAGISGPVPTPIGQIEADVFTEVMLTNALAPARIAERYRDLVAPDGTVAVMSSELGSIAQNRSGLWETYRMSKAALNMALRSIAARNKDDGLTYIAVAPGWIRTDMGGPSAIYSIEENIPKVVDMLEQRRGSGGMRMIDFKNQELPW